MRRDGLPNKQCSLACIHKNAYTRCLQFGNFRFGSGEATWLLEWPWLLVTGSVVVYHLCLYLVAWGISGSASSAINKGLLGIGIMLYLRRHCPTSLHTTDTPWSVDSEHDATLISLLCMGICWLGSTCAWADTRDSSSFLSVIYHPDDIFALNAFNII